MKINNQTKKSKKINLDTLYDDFLNELFECEKSEQYEKVIIKYVDIVKKIIKKPKPFLKQIVGINYEGKLEEYLSQIAGVFQPLLAILYIGLILHILKGKKKYSKQYTEINVLCVKLIDFFKDVLNTNKDTALFADKAYELLIKIGYNVIQDSKDTIKENNRYKIKDSKVNEFEFLKEDLKKLTNALNIKRLNYFESLCKDKNLKIMNRALGYCLFLIINESSDKADDFIEDKINEGKNVDIEKSQFKIKYSVIASFFRLKDDIVYIKKRKTIIENSIKIDENIDDENIKSLIKKCNFYLKEYDNVHDSGTLVRYAAGIKKQAIHIQAEIEFKLNDIKEDLELENDIEKTRLLKVSNKFYRKLLKDIKRLINQVNVDLAAYSINYKSNDYQQPNDNEFINNSNLNKNNRAKTTIYDNIYGGRSIKGIIKICKFLKVEKRAFNNARRDYPEYCPYPIQYKNITIIALENHLKYWWENYVSENDNPTYDNSVFEK